MARSRKRSYSYSAYKPNRRFGRKPSYYGKSRIRWQRVLAIVAVVVVVVGIVVGLNFNRIRLMFKGYSFKEQSAILKLDKEALSTILDDDKLDHITDWIETSENYKYYDEYEYYLSTHEDDDVQVVVTYIDDVYDNYVSKLKTLNYTSEQIWDVLQTASVKDVKYVVSHNYTYDDMLPFMQVSGFKFQDMEKYLEAYEDSKNYNYAVLITTYPFIISENESEDQKEYTITNPDDILTLVKKGFYYSSDYEPEDLVVPDVAISTDCDKENAQLRQEAATALEEMFADASKEGYNLVINSAYRSYSSQEEIYKDYFEKYDEKTAESLVALPGASEHQSGLGVDLTCQSVIDDKLNGVENSKFSYKPDYKWCAANSYKYGFILRYEGDKVDITGIGNEEWHFRYVGKEAAEIIFNNGWTLEEYCLNYGVLPEIKALSDK